MTRLLHRWRAWILAALVILSPHSPSASNSIDHMHTVWDDRSDLNKQFITLLKERNRLKTQDGIWHCYGCWDSNRGRDLLETSLEDENEHDYNSCASFDVSISVETFGRRCPEIDSACASDTICLLNAFHDTQSRLNTLQRLLKDIHNKKDDQSTFMFWLSVLQWLCRTLFALTMVIYCSSLPFERHNPFTIADQWVPTPTKPRVETITDQHSVPVGCAARAEKCTNIADSDDEVDESALSDGTIRVRYSPRLLRQHDSNRSSVIRSGGDKTDDEIEVGSGFTSSVARQLFDGHGYDCATSLPGMDNAAVTPTFDDIAMNSTERCIGALELDKENIFCFNQPRGTRGTADYCSSRKSNSACSNSITTKDAASNFDRQYQQSTTNVAQKVTAVQNSQLQTVTAQLQSLRRELTARDVKIRSLYKTIDHSRDEAMREIQQMRELLSIAAMEKQELQRDLNLRKEQDADFLGAIKSFGDDWLSELSVYLVED